MGQYLPLPKMSLKVSDNTKENLEGLDNTEMNNEDLHNSETNFQVSQNNGINHEVTGNNEMDFEVSDSNKMNHVVTNNTEMNSEVSGTNEMNHKVTDNTEMNFEVPGNNAMSHESTDNTEMNEEVSESTKINFEVLHKSETNYEVDYESLLQPQIIAKNGFPEISVPQIDTQTKLHNMDKHVDVEKAENTSPYLDEVIEVINNDVSLHKNERNNIENHLDTVVPVNCLRDSLYHLDTDIDSLVQIYRIESETLVHEPNDDRNSDCMEVIYILSSDGENDVSVTKKNLTNNENDHWDIENDQTRNENDCDIENDVIDKENTPVNNVISENDTDHCSGYHSSDFEFITQSEAEEEGLIIKPKTKKKTTKKKTTKKNYQISKLFLPVIKDSKHDVPNGEDFVKLFKEQNLGRKRKDVYNNMPKMSVEYDKNNVAKALKSCEDLCDEETKREACETAMLISKMYPRENALKTRLKTRRFV